MGLNNDILSIPAKDFKKLLKYGRRSDTFGKYKAKELIYYPYRFVKETLPNHLSSGEFEEILTFLFKIRNPHKIKPQKVLPLILWLYDGLKRIGEFEKETLSSTPEPDMVNAGIETLNEIGEYNVVDMLVKEWGVYTHEEIWEMQYEKVWIKQRKMKLENDVQKNLLRIQKDKAKRR